ncbi:putative low-complexity protein [Xenococcus sp. PCC 7305]|uniref:pentapeptide repeat-containing protein n=1 Tax=Xenococcus sp. PCC 7305 TaxID=102125 RepID=UPI0002ACD61C|nr:pentapeptide repeat-containing protein [Xenococcus sp. PCC 7305]ELS03210.1 putative low-complexity protein [Xenococcus sp. PCC 7305]
MTEYGILVKKTIFGLNKTIGVNFRDLFKAVGKAIADYKFGKWNFVAKDGVDVLAALGLQQDAGHLAWLLIYRSLDQAIHQLVEDNLDLFTGKFKNYDEYDAIAEGIDFSLENTEIVIDSSFFKHPKQILQQININQLFLAWLQCYSLNNAAATSICQRLPSYFVFALNQEWHARASDYASINEFFHTPVADAAERENSWRLYNAWLQKQIDEPMFAEAFGLRQVYIQPRAYYEQEIENNHREEDDYGRGIDKKHKKIVVELESNLITWINKADSRDAIRIISGDPGSGKSSFSKMLAAKLSKIENIRTLCIPLHLFDPTGDLVEAVGKFIRYDKYLSHNPLDREQESSKLLIIFDGLDELAMQGKLGAEVAKSFIGEVQKTVNFFNRQEKQAKLQIIISGRPVIISSNRDELRKTEQILHVLSYVVEERDNYQDKKNLLREDQRNSWWKKYGSVTGKNYTAMPEELKLKNLVEITSQPLLNYLVALSYIRSQDESTEDTIIFSEETNLNAIYQDLLKSVYDRGWDTDQHPTLKGVEYKNFVRILEEIALAAWHGNGRTTTVKEIQAHCESSGLKILLEKFTEGAKSGVTRLLTAFYFRQSGYGKDGDRTFEFTHKSFGEYLTAKRIVRELIKINRQLKNREDDPDEGWDEKQALTRWIVICGMSAINEYLFKFICDEISLYQTETVKQWQETLSNLISFMLRQGMPMEKLDPRPPYQEECRQGRNAEEALLVVVNASARSTQERSNINWRSEYSFGKWLSRLQNHTADDDKIIINQCLNWLNLYRANLYRANLYRANLVRANLDGANLEGANLVRANLVRANLVRANLDGANLNGAILEGANLEKAILEGANFRGANLNEANLRGAHLSEANFQEADFDRADLQRVDFDRADFQGADFDRAIMDDNVRRKIESLSTNKHR